MLDVTELRRLLRYDPETGAWTWLVTNSNRAPAGTVTFGSPCPRGDLQIRIHGRIYKSHRLAWLYMTGEWPERQIDHEDLDRSNNRWLNLRPANNSQNNANRRVRAESSTGVKGVIRINSKAHPYEARIRENGTVRVIGYFATLGEASAAYKAAAEAYFGKFARAA